MKKRYFFLLIAFLLLWSMALGMVSCKQNTSGGQAASDSDTPLHTHQFARKWSWDGLSHWLPCQIAGCTIMDQYGRHVYGSDPQNSICTVCGAERTTGNGIGFGEDDVTVSWSVSDTEALVWIATERDSLNRVLRKTHYAAEETVGSHTLTVWKKLCEEQFVYEDGRLIYVTSYSYVSSPDSILPTDGTPTVTHTLQYQYDANGRRIRADVLNEYGFATGSYDLYRYDENGNEVTLLQYDANRPSRTLTRNKAGDVLKSNRPSGKEWTYTYDTSGNVHTATDGKRLYTFAYENGYPRTASITDAASAERTTLSYEFDENGMLTSAEAVTGAKKRLIQYSYLPSGKLTELSCVDSTTGDVVISLTNRYSKIEKPLQITLKEHTENGVISERTIYSYDEQNLLISIRWEQTENEVTLREQNYLLSYVSGALSRWSSEGRTMEYTYGDNGKVLQTAVTDAKGKTVTTYDENGNPLKQTYAEPAGASFVITRTYEFGKVSHDYLFQREFAEHSRPMEYYARRIETATAVTERIFDGLLQANKATETAKNGSYKTVSIYTYGEDERLRGEERKVSLFAANGTLTDAYRILISYGKDEAPETEEHYDADERLFKKLEYTKGSAGSYLRRMTEYAENGGKTVTRYSEDGSLLETIVYDENGTILPSNR